MHKHYSDGPWRKAGAEFIGMTLFVLCGAGTAMANGGTNGTFVIALAFGMAIFVLASSIGHHSGGQMNCAVTLCLVLTKQLTWEQGLMNALAQLMGSITASIILLILFTSDSDKTGGFATNQVAVGFTQGNGMIGEIVGTFLLCFVVMEVVTEPKSSNLNLNPKYKYKYKT